MWQLALETLHWKRLEFSIDFRENWGLAFLFSRKFIVSRRMLKNDCKWTRKKWRKISYQKTNNSIISGIMSIDEINVSCHKQKIKVVHCRFDAFNQQMGHRTQHETRKHLVDLKFRKNEEKPDRVWHFLFETNSGSARWVMAKHSPMRLMLVDDQMEILIDAMTKRAKAAQAHFFLH